MAGKIRRLQPAPTEQGVGRAAKEAEMLAEEPSVFKTGTVFVDEADRERHPARGHGRDRFAAGHDLDRQRGAGV